MPVGPTWGRGHLSADVLSFPARRESESRSRCGEHSVRPSDCQRLRSRALQATGLEPYRDRFVGVRVGCWPGPGTDAATGGRADRRWVAELGSR